MHTLGQTSNGFRIDLVSLLDQLCSDCTNLSKFAKKFLRANPEWEQLAIDAARKYFDDLATIQPNEHSTQTAQQLGLPIAKVCFANAISLMILFGYSHYLQWTGFEIVEPTRFDEISSKLSFAREAIVKVGFSLASSVQMHFGAIYSCTSQATFHLLLECYKLGFGIGIALGYLTTEAHLRNTEAAVDLLAKDGS